MYVSQQFIVMETIITRCEVQQFVLNVYNFCVYYCAFCDEFMQNGQ